MEIQKFDFIDPIPNSYLFFIASKDNVWSIQHLNYLQTAEIYAK